ncbi:hypothetical protein ACJQWK_09848 [Exserohilum turcicum]
MIETLQIEAQLSEEREKEAEERNKKVEKDKNEAEEYIKRYDSALEEEQNAREKLQKSLKDAIEDLQDEKNKTKQLKKLKNTSETQLSDSELEKDSLKKSLSDAKHENDTLKRLLSDSKLENKILRNRLSETEKENEELRNKSSDKRLEKIPDTSPLVSYAQTVGSQTGPYSDFKRRISDDDHSITETIKDGWKADSRKRPKLGDGEPTQKPRKKNSGRKPRDNDSKRTPTDKKRNISIEEGPKCEFTFPDVLPESMQAQEFFAGSDGKNVSSQGSTASPSF